MSRRKDEMHDPASTFTVGSTHDEYNEPSVPSSEDRQAATSTFVNYYAGKDACLQDTLQDAMTLAA